MQFNKGSVTSGCALVSCACTKDVTVADSAVVTVVTVYSELAIVVTPAIGAYPGSWSPRCVHQFELSEDFEYECSVSNVRGLRAEVTCLQKPDSAVYCSGMLAVL